MKKNLFSTMLALLTIVGMLVSVGCKNYDDDISDINKKISDLSSVTSTLQSAVSTAQSAADAAKSAAAAAQTAADNAAAAAKTAQSAADKAEADAVAAQATANAALTTAEAAVTQAQLEELKTLLEKADAALAGDIKKNADSIAALTARVENALSRIEVLETSVEAIKKVDENQYALINALFKKMTVDSTALETFKVKAQEAHDALTKDIKTLTENLANTKKALEDADDTLQANIDALGVKVQTNSDSIAILNTEIQNLKDTIDVLKKDLEDKIAAAKQKAETDLATAKTDLETQIANAEKKAADDLAAAKQTLETADATLQQNIDAVKAAVEELSKYVNQMLTSIVFRPQAYIDGIEGVWFGRYPYKGLICGDEYIDSENEMWDEEDTQKYIYPRKWIEYDLNSKTFTQDSIAGTSSIKFNIDDVEYIERTKSTEFGLVCDSVVIEKGILKLRVRPNGTPAAAGDKITRFNIAVTSKGGRVITSDYAAVSVMEIENFYIAKDKGATDDEHFRIGYDGVKISDTDGFNKYAYYKGPAWNTKGETTEEVTPLCDYTVPYNAKTNLMDFVKLHVEAGECKDFTELEEYGFSYNFEIVKNFKIGVPATDQELFANITDSTFTPRYNNKDFSTACIGRSPIVRVQLKHGSDVVKVAYIRVVMTREVLSKEMNVWKTGVSQGETPDGNFDEYNLDPSKADTSWCYTTVDDMNAIYDSLEVSKEVFHSTYTQLVDDEESSALGAAYQKVLTPGTATYVIAWGLNEDEVWAHASELEEQVITHKCHFENPTTGDRVDITLKGSLIRLTKKVKVAGRVAEYWDENTTLFNVKVPDFNYASTWADPDSCQFLSNINASFVIGTDYHNYPMVKLIEYDNYSPMCSLPVQMTLVDSVEYMLSSGNFKDVSSIKHIGHACDSITVNKKAVCIGTDYSKILNDENNAKVNISAVGYLSGRADRAVKIYFPDKSGNYSENFEGQFLRPVDVNKQSPMSFIDGHSLTTAGTYIPLDTLINPKDWRGNVFGKLKYKAYYEKSEYVNPGSYWKYYSNGDLEVTPGVKNKLGWSIEVNIAGVTTNLNGGTLGTTPLPKDIKLNVDTTDIDASVPTYGTYGEEKLTSYFGFLTYVNNGTVVNKDFTIRVPVTVNYGWGAYDATVDITVHKTDMN